MRYQSFIPEAGTSAGINMEQIGGLRLTGENPVSGTLRQSMFGRFRAEGAGGKRAGNTD